MSFLFIYLILMTLPNHPLSLIFFIILNMLISMFLLIFLNKSTWLSMIFILLMLGGLLILFMYMSSLIPNLKFSKMNILFFLALLLFLLNKKNFMNISTYSKNFMELNSISSSFQFFNCLMAMLYLFLSMILILEILSFIMTPLRSKF